MEYKKAMKTIFEDLMSGLDEVDAFLGGETAGYKVNLPAEVDVKGIRKRLKMTQARFSDTFGFSLDAVKHWEGGRRTPESSARAFLTVIAKNPNAVIAALHPQLGQINSRRGYTEMSTGDNHRNARPTGRIFYP
jgi:putative transcriptional regulator